MATTPNTRMLRKMIRQFRYAICIRWSPSPRLLPTFTSGREGLPHGSRRFDRFLKLPTLHLTSLEYHLLSESRAPKFGKFDSRFIPRLTNQDFTNPKSFSYATALSF